MKTNLTNIMANLKEAQREFNNIEWYLRSHNSNTEVKELNGNSELMETVEDFEEKWNRATVLMARISYLKGVIAEQNVKNMVKTTGTNVTTALALLASMRERLNTINQLMEVKLTKRRISEKDNAYYLVKTPVFDLNYIKKCKEKLTEQIEAIELEISGFNSQMIEIDDFKEIVIKIEE